MTNVFESVYTGCMPKKSSPSLWKNLSLYAPIALAVVVAVGVMTVTPSGSAQAKSDRCATIQEGQLKNSANERLTLGNDRWGYNYQAHSFDGGYCEAYRNAAWCQSYAEDHLAMKWNDAWLSNQDCNGDGLLDRHSGQANYRGSGAWLTNHMSGVYEQDGQSCPWNYFTKIVAVPSDATLSNGRWLSADGTVIGDEIWGEFAIIQEVENDSCGGVHGRQRLSEARAGLGNW